MTDRKTRRADSIRVLYSFPHKLGADRICHTAWQQVNGLAAAEVRVLAMPGVLHRAVPDTVEVRPTLAMGTLRIPYKAVGKMRALALHDRIVARRLAKLKHEVDIVHVWPAAAVRTLKVAAELGIPTVLERPNAHTRVAFETVRREFDRLGLLLPPTDEYFYRADLLEKEEEEYRLANYLLCPSDFVIKTFLDQGFPKNKLLRHSYGFDDRTFHPDSHRRGPSSGLTLLFVGVCAVRKGVHFALEAWLRSPASDNGTFLIAGEFLPAYRDKLSSLLSHPSVKVLGQRSDVPDLMRQSDALVLPSIEEGSPLVVAEAVGSGCVPLVSDACTAFCTHMRTGLIHRVGNVEALTEHITMLDRDRGLLATMREAVLRDRVRFTWSNAGITLHEAYRDAIANYNETLTGPHSDDQRKLRAF